MTTDGITVDHFTLPKLGHAPQENEDAAAGPVMHDRAVRVAVADGATESAFAGLWAHLLAQSLVTSTAGDEALGLAEAVKAARRRFVIETADRVQGLPWYAAAKAEQGAFAAVVAVEVCADRSWRAVAVGDACVLVTGPKGALRRAWPLDHPSAFSNRPALVPSRPGRDVIPVRTEGELAVDDVLLLATDALAAFLIEHVGARKDVLQLQKLDAFEQFVAGACTGGLRNDDVTLLRLQL